MSGALSLSASIATMDRETLEALVAQRRVLSPAAVNNPLDLALELLRSDSINRALQGAHRDSLAALRNLKAHASADSEQLELLRGRGLVGVNSQTNDVVELPEVVGALAALDPRFITDKIVLDAPQVDTSTWYGAALTSVRRAAQLLRTLARRSVRLGRKGVPTALALREVADVVHADPETIGRLLEVMRGAGLLVTEIAHDGSEQLMTSPAGVAWLDEDYANRWISLASAAASQIDNRLRLGLDAYHDSLGAVVQQLAVDYPLLPDAEREFIERVAATADDLGLTVTGQLTEAARVLLNGDIESATRLANHSLPAPVSGVYLQPDLSLIVPGPLQPSDEAALSLFADTEQLGPAASLRLSPSSLSRGVRSGLSAAQIREVLQRLSLTGIPQPLDYLLGELERKAPSAQPEQPTTVDYSAFSAFSRTEAAAATKLTRASNATAATNPSSTPGVMLIEPSSELTAMVERVYSAAQNDTDDAGMLRQLELAIRDRSAVKVIAVAGAHEREFVLQPVSLRGGRLRATDQLAGVERTIPVSAITVVASA